MSKPEKFYISIPHLLPILDCSRSTAERIVKGMQQSGDYPPETFLVRPRRVLFDAVMDYCGKGKE